MTLGLQKQWPTTDWNLNGELVRTCRPQSELDWSRRVCGTLMASLQEFLRYCLCSLLTFNKNTLESPKQK